MATLITGQSQLLTLQPSDKYTVTVGANTEAYIDLGAGTDGSGYDSVRLTSEGTNKYTIGEYGRVAKVTIRCVVGSVNYVLGSSDIEKSVIIDGGLFEFLPSDSVAKWTPDKLPASVSVTVDETVTFNGRPSIKVVVPAGVSGTVRVGGSAADVLMPSASWARDNFFLAFRSSNLDAHAGTVSALIGDASFANFYTTGFNRANFPDYNCRNNEWLVHRPSSLGVGAGTPAMAQFMRLRLSMTFTAQATDTTVWFAAVGAVTKRKKPTIILTWDDGYKSWFDFIRPLAKYYGIPVSMGIACDLVGSSAGMMTWDNIKELHNDPSGLFDIVNHARVNESYAQGANVYIADLIKCRDLLRANGIDHDGVNHHPYVQSLYGNDLVDLLEANNFLTARASTYAFARGQDYAIESGKNRWLMNICSNLQTGKSLAQAQTDIQAVITDKGFGCINAHDFAAADGAYIWSYDKTTQLFEWLAQQRDAGNIEIKSWSRWFSDLTGRGYIKP